MLPFPYPVPPIVGRWFRVSFCQNGRKEFLQGVQNFNLCNMPIGLMEILEQSCKYTGWPIETTCFWNSYIPIGHPVLLYCLWRIWTTWQPPLIIITKPVFSKTKITNNLLFCRKKMLYLNAILLMMINTEITMNRRVWQTDWARTYETKGKISTKTDVSEDRPHLVHLYER